MPRKRGGTDGGTASNNVVQLPEKSANHGATKNENGGTGRESGWAVRGVSPETQTAIRKAASRAGLTIGEWIEEHVRPLATAQLKGGAVGPTQDQMLGAILQQLEKRDEAMADLADQVKALQERRSWWRKVFG